MDETHGAVADDCIVQGRFADSRAAAAAVVLFGAAVFLFRLGAPGLWPDEARYAEIAREMLSARDFVVPHLNYVPYIEKPPLLYWLTSASFATLGLGEFAARLVSAASALVGVLATFIFADRTFGRRRALLSSAILVTAPLYAIMAQVLTTDMLLTALVTIANFALFLHWREGGRWCWLAYAAMAMATLTKGPVGVALPVLAMVLFLWWEGDLRGALGRFHAFLGFVLIAAVAAPWFVAISLREPGFVDFYFIGEHLRRIFQPSYSHGEPPYFYVPALIGGLLPWSLVAPALKWRGVVPNPARRFCVVASAVPVGVFSLASAKLVPYILPAFAPLAILLGDAIAATAWPRASGGKRTSLRPAAALIALGPVLAAVGVGALVAAVVAPLVRSPYPMAVRPALCAVGAILVAGGIVVTVGILARRAGAGLTLVMLTIAAALWAGTWARAEAEPLRSYAALARAIMHDAPEATVICYHRYVQELPFYTRRRVILIGAQTELRFGAKHSPDSGQYFFRTDADLLRLWSRPGVKVLVLEVDDLARLRRQLGCFTVIGSEHTKRAIVSEDERPPCH